MLRIRYHLREKAKYNSMSRRGNDSISGRESAVTQLKLAILISGGGTNLQALIDGQLLEKV